MVVLKVVHKVVYWDDRWAEKLGFVMADSSADLLVDGMADCLARLMVVHSVDGKVEQMVE